MNRLAADLDLKNTHFTNAAGLYDPDHYSTARDLAVLAETALQDKTLAKIVKQQRETIVSLGIPPHEYQLRTTNRLLGEAGIHGVKTGSLPQAGACLVVAKYVHGRNRVIVVVLGSEFAYDADGMIDPDTDLRWADARAILDALERDFRWLSPADPNDLPGLTDELAAWQVTLKDQSAIVIPASQADALRYRLKLGPEGLPDQPVGSLLFFLGTTQIAERPLFQLAAG
jgi:D-alanyl-D-alanine carboxypeptidase